MLWDFIDFLMEFSYIAAVAYLVIMTRDKFSKKDDK